MQRATDVAYTLACPLSNVNDTEIYIYSASQLQSIGDLSGLMVGYADFSMATRLQSLKVGDAADSYSNGNLTELYLGKTVGQVDIRKKYGINILAVKTGQKLNSFITSDTQLSEDKTLMVMGKYKDLQKCFKI